MDTPRNHYRRPNSPRPKPLGRAVALRLNMTTGRHRPENYDWKPFLTYEDSCLGEKSDGTMRRSGYDPMTVPPDILADAGHPCRRTGQLVNAIKALGGGRGDDGDIVANDIRGYRDIPRHCLGCAGSSHLIRRCVIIDCPFWAYRYGRNPHSPRRGKNPFAKKADM